MRASYVGLSLLLPRRRPHRALCQRRSHYSLLPTQPDPTTQSIIQQFGVTRRGITTSGTMPVVRPTPAPPDTMAPAPAPSQTAATPAPSPSPSAPPRRSPRLAGEAPANPAGLHTAHIEGESSVRLFDLSRSVSVPTAAAFSTEAAPYRFHLLDERLDGPILATVASRWFGRSVATCLELLDSARGFGSTVA